MHKKIYPTVNAGKNGLTENLINEINFQLEKHGAVKVKMLRSFRNKERRELAEQIASKVSGRLVDLKGYVITFKRC
jgi:RNA-binding protein